MDLSALAGARGALKKTETKETTMLDIVGGNTGNLVVASEVTSKYICGFFFFFFFFFFPF